MYNSPQNRCPLLPWMIDFNSCDRKNLDNQNKAALASSSLKHKEALSIRSPAPKCHLTGIMCPIPPNITVETLRMVMEQHVSVAVFKMTDYPDEEQLDLILNKFYAVKDKYSVKMRRIMPVALAFEMQGNAIRTGNIKNSLEVELSKGDITHLTADQFYKQNVTKNMIYLDYPDLTTVVKSGDKIMLGSESVTLSALDAVEHALRCIVEKAGKILNNEVVSIKGSPISIPEISVIDEKCMELASKKHIDILIMTGIKNARTIQFYKDKIGDDGKYILLLAKIETLQAVDNINSIIKEVDGIVIDTEKLLVELGPSKLYVVQKAITAKCIKASKPVVCTVHFFSIKPAEVLEISNLVADAVDCLYITRAPRDDNDYFDNLKKLVKICAEAEAATYTKQFFDELVDMVGSSENPERAISLSVVQLSFKVNAVIIVLLTVTGRTAKLISSFKPRCPVIAITRCENTAQQLHLYRGITTLFYVKPPGEDWHKDSDERIQMGITFAKVSGFVKGGDAMVTLKGFKPGCGFTNTIRVVYASSYDTSYAHTKF